MKALKLTAAAAILAAFAATGTGEDKKLASPLTVSCVIVPVVELCRMTGDIDDELLTSQLYATMPFGSLTAFHEMVNGTVTDAPFDGDNGVGAGGAAAATPPPPNIAARTANSTTKRGAS